MKWNVPMECFKLAFVIFTDLELRDEHQALFVAKMNNSNRMYQVAHCCYLGIGVEIDKHKAFTYYLKSVKASNAAMESPNSPII
ncbi:hypothetical protein F8M41_009964 [Gigaspora margarita]|uniref:Uncharacterized protein n=1 Tax=Gigaspora margarita TaxID=4874 RepID=A0A8H4EVC2_GIGMA|nr:hypothetical protein F8M41_009964 [Gigaspora margarita]